MINGQTPPHCSACLLCCKTGIIRNMPAAHTLVTHSQRGFNRVLSSGHTQAPSQLTQWEAVIVDWLRICTGVVAFRQLGPFQKSPSLIQGQWKESTSWVNSMRDTRAERGLQGWSNAVSSFRYGWGVISYSDTESTCTHQSVFNLALSKMTFKVTYAYIT